MLLSSSAASCCKLVLYVISVEHSKIHTKYYMHSSLFVCDVQQLFQQCWLASCFCGSNRGVSPTHMLWHCRGWL